GRSGDLELPGLGVRHGQDLRSETSGSPMQVCAANGSSAFMLSGIRPSLMRTAAHASEAIPPPTMKVFGFTPSDLRLVHTELLSHPPRVLEPADAGRPFRGHGPARLWVRRPGSRSGAPPTTASGRSGPPAGYCPRARRRPSRGAGRRRRTGP